MSGYEGTNLTQGGIYKTLLKFAIPYLIANFLQSVYGAADMMIVGWYSDSAGISAVYTGTQIMMILTCAITGLAMGGTIQIAQFYGADKKQDAVQTISTLFTLFAGIAAVLTVGMLLLAPVMLKALQTPAEAVEQARQYVLICSGGIIFIVGYNVISAILRGLGDSVSPLLFIGIACVMNIVLDLVFVGGFHWGAAGAAAATSASQAVSMIMAILYLSKRDFIFQFKRKNFRIYKDKAKNIFKLGLPVCLQESILNLSFLFIAAIVNSLGVTASAAVGICEKFESFAMLPAFAFSGAIATITAQNIGAEQPQRAKKSLKASILLSFGCSVFFFVWVQLFPASVLQLFKADAQVTLAGIQYIRPFSFDFMLVAFCFCLNGFFNGCGKTTFSMINGIATSLFIRVPLAYILTTNATTSLAGIGISTPAASAVSVAVSLWYLKKASHTWLGTQDGLLKAEV